MCVTLIGWKRIHFWTFLPPLLLKISRSPLFREHCTPNAPFLCSSTNPSLIRRWPTDGKKTFIPSAVKRKVECFVEYFTSITHDVTGWATCPVPVSCCHGDANRYARSLSISVPRSLIMDYRRCLSTEQRTENGFSEVYYVCWLCKSSRPFTWIKKIKNCCEQRLTFQTMQSPSWKKRKWVAVKRRTFYQS